MTRTLIAGGEVVDGTGGEPRRADVLVEGDRIVAVAPDIRREADDRVIDAGGRVVTPGFVDIHTHYDAQVFWGPELSSSCHHGVTTVINGNCGFSLAPYSRETRPLVIRMLRDLEDMYTDTLEATVPDAVPTFGGYLSEVERAGPMLNFGSFIGHSTLRLTAMGSAAYERPANAEEARVISGLLDAAMAAGAMGFATKTTPSPNSAPSQFASTEETLDLLRVFGAHKRGVAMFNAGGTFDLEQVYKNQAEIGRPFTWIALLAMPDGSHRARTEFHRDWWRRGADVHPQVSCRALVAQCRMSLPSALRAPMLSALNGKPDAERIAAYAAPSWRALLAEEIRSVHRGPVDWDQVHLLESPGAPQLEGRDLASLSAERGLSPLEFLLDLAVADKLSTRIVVTYGNGDRDEVAKLLKVEGAVLGLSDAGAHPAQTCDAVMPTDLLGNWVRERGALTFEQAIHKLTQEPAMLMGLAGRGVIAPGYHADLAVLDPKTIAPGPLRTVADLPAGRERLLADQPSGVHHVLVNGMLIRENETTLRVPAGRVLRS